MSEEGACGSYIFKVPDVALVETKRIGYLDLMQIVNMIRHGPIMLVVLPILCF